jgi:hypothetical protein
MATSFLSAVWCGEALQRPGDQDVSEFDSDCCSVLGLMEEEEKGEKGREKPQWGGRFPRAGPGPDLPY